MADRDDGGIRGQNCVGRRRALDLREYLLLEFELFWRGFEHPIGVRDAGFERVDDLDTGQRSAISAKIVEISADPVQDAIAHLDARIGDRHAMARAGEHLRDSVAHQAAAEDRDALRSHRHPAV